MTEEEFRMQMVKGLSTLEATVTSEMGHIKGDIQEMKGDMKDIQEDVQEVRDIAKAPHACTPCKEKSDCHMETIESTVRWNKKLTYALIVATLTVAVKVVWSAYERPLSHKEAKTSTTKSVKKIN